MAKRSKVEAIKEFFGTPDKPITNQELLDLRREDKDGYDELGALTIAALEASDSA